MRIKKKRTAIRSADYEYIKKPISPEESSIS